MQCRKPMGNAMIEWLIAIPIVMLVGLSILQWALLIQARHAVDFAVRLGVRHASVAHGHATAIERGLVLGLRPFWSGAIGLQAPLKLKAGIASRWLHWQRIFPDAKVFADFAVPARDERGRAISGKTEIPNDNLRYRDDTPGGRSGLSVQEANRFGLQLTYGVPLTVPLIGAFAARIMELVDGCIGAESLILVRARFGETGALNGGRRWPCAIYRAPETVGGPAVWRWPVRVSAMAYMQSSLRSDAATSSDSVAGLTPPSRAVVRPPLAGRRFLEPDKVASGRPGPVIVPRPDDDYPSSRPGGQRPLPGVLVPGPGQCG